MRAETGLRVRALGGEDEARLTFRSALAHFDLGVGRWVVMDIGGGSIELALSADGLLDRLISLPFGAIRLTEQFLGAAHPGRWPGAPPRHPRPAPHTCARRCAHDLPVRDWRGAQVIGSGGTFTNLAGMYLARQARRDRAHGARDPRAARRARAHALRAAGHATGRARRRARSQSRRAPTSSSRGSRSIAEVVARVEAREIAVSAYGIREGLLLETARVTPTVADPGEARARSVRELAERSHYEAPHARARADARPAAVSTRSASGLGCEPGDREILADAALLHDIGYHINYNKHHKHSYHLILHADLLGMTRRSRSPSPLWRDTTAARRPKKSHEDYARLDRARATAHRSAWRRSSAWPTASTADMPGRSRASKCGGSAARCG